MRRLQYFLSALCLIFSGLIFQSAMVNAQSENQVELASDSNLVDEKPQALNDGWETARPSDAGFDTAGLVGLTEAVNSGEIHNVHAVLIEHGGKLVYEQYFEGPDEAWGGDLGLVKFDHNTLHDLRSVSKSVASALVGIALEGKYREALERPIVEFFPELEGQFAPGVEDITLKHVLTMTAGFEWNEMTVPYTNPDNDEIRLYYSDKPIARVLARPVITPPGSQWYYNGGLSQVLTGVVRNVTGQAFQVFAQERLFKPLGITHYEWLGPAGWDAPSAASGLRMRTRDLAKIGSLFLHKGVWQGQQIIPAEWVELSGEHHVKEIPWGRSTATYGYGFMWYPGRANGPDAHRIIRAAGNGNQRIFILPDLKLNIIVYAGNYNDYSHRSDAKVLDRVLGALKR